MIRLTGHPTGAMERANEYVRENSLLFIFATLAVGIRILFLIFTERTWEDVLILNSVTNNFWDGDGLTHQVSESPIQSYSSVVWMLFSLVGNAVGQGLWFVKIVSLLATVATIFFAYQIAKKWEVSMPGVILILGLLSFEQVHVTFGMSGMESQFATAFILFGIWSLIQERRISLMLTATMAPLVRPELVFWTLIVLTIYVFRPRLLSFKAVTISLIPVGVWFLIAWSYYGTVIPQTVTAKSLLGTTNLTRSAVFNGLDQSLSAADRIAPYFSNYFASSALIPRDYGRLVVIFLVALFILGTFKIARKSRVWAIPAIIAPMFALYVGFFNVSNYHMWYVPPFSAVFFLYAGAAFQRRNDSKRSMGKRALTNAVPIVVLLVYLVPSISYFQHERYVQREIDTSVREVTGNYLNSIMRNSEVVVLEPLGFLGAQVIEGEVVDYPGLASRKMTSALSLIPMAARNMGTATLAISPDYVVVRQDEWKTFISNNPGRFNDYGFVAAFGEPSNVDLDFFGATYSNSDRYFEIYAKQKP